jgi:hypothetical protein
MRIRGFSAVLLVALLLTGLTPASVSAADPPDVNVLHLTWDTAEEVSWEHGEWTDGVLTHAVTRPQPWDVGLRHRGNSAIFFPKWPWKAEFKGSDPFPGGWWEMNLNAEYVDQTLLRTYLGYDLFRRVGVPAPRVAYAPLYLNGAYGGLFVQIEQVDERFLASWGLPPHGNLYKSDAGDFHMISYDQILDAYPKKSNRDAPSTDLYEFLLAVNYLSDDAFPSTIGDQMDVNGWIDWYAVNVLIGNYEMVAKNFYLYHSFADDRWHILPWDVDLTWGHNYWKQGTNGLLDTTVTWDNPIDSGTEESPKEPEVQNPTSYESRWNMLIDRMMEVPEFRFLYCRRLSEIMAEAFTVDAVSQRATMAYSSIASWGAADPYKWEPTCCPFDQGPAEIEQYTAGRIAFIQGQMPAFCPDLPVPLSINELMVDNTAIVQDEAGEYEPWIELRNDSALLTWDLTGMYLSTDPANPTMWQIPTLALGPGDTALLWADGETDAGDAHADLQLDPLGGWLGLYDRDVHGQGLITSVSYNPAATNVVQGRPHDAAGWASLPAATPGWPNGGRPPFIEAVTHRTAHDFNRGAATVQARIYEAGAGIAPPASGGHTLPHRVYLPLVSAAPTSDATVAAVVHYRAWDGIGALPSSYTSVPMTVQDGVHQAVIPPHSDGVWIDFYIEAVDANGQRQGGRPGWPRGDHYRYVVGWQHPGVYINEIVAINSRSPEDDSGTPEDWVELYNANEYDIDVGGMYLSDDMANRTKWMIPSGTVIPAGGYQVVWLDSDDEEGALHANFSLAGRGEQLLLTDAAARCYVPVDAVFYPPQAPNTAWGRLPAPPAPDPSWAVATEQTSVHGGGAWYALSAPTPGAPNAGSPTVRASRSTRWPAAGETVTVTALVTGPIPVQSATLWWKTGSVYQAAPMTGDGTTFQVTLPAQDADRLVQYYIEVVDALGQRATSPPGAPGADHRYVAGHPFPAIQITEFMALNNSTLADEAGEFDDWVELHNASAEPVDVGGMALSDDLAQRTRWIIPVGTVIPAGGRLVFWLDGDVTQGGRHASFSLNREGESVALFASPTLLSVPLDQVTFSYQAADVSQERIGDDWQPSYYPTPWQ